MRTTRHERPIHALRKGTSRHFSVPWRAYHLLTAQLNVMSKSERTLCFKSRLKGVHQVAQPCPTTYARFWSTLSPDARPSSHAYCTRTYYNT